MNENIMATTKKERLTTNSVVLITGGAKGITAECSIAIAKRAKCNLVLIGRSILQENTPEWAQGKGTEEALKASALRHFKSRAQKITPKALNAAVRDVLSDRKINDTLNKISEAGANAIYLSTDVTDKKSVKSAVETATSTFGEISGVIHGAGNLADKKIENKTASDFDLVVDTKMKGLENIIEAINPKALDFLILFSSVAGFYGNAGQTDYAIANEMLNKSAYMIEKSLPNCHVVSINWGPWDSGMVSPRLKKYFEAKNIPLISTEFGVSVLMDALSGEKSRHPQIVVGSQLDFPAVLSEKRPDVITIRRDIAHQENPFLNDHRIGPRAVLPATCACAWIVDSALSIHPGYFFTKMEDFKILKGITFDNDSHGYDVKLEPADGSDGKTISYDVQITSSGKNKRTVFHYSGHVALSATRPQIPISQPVDELGLDENSIQPGQSLYQDGTFFHGPSFEGIQKVLDITEKRIITEVLLPTPDEQNQGQFAVKAVNPFINDAVVQSLLLWTQRHYDAPCLPSRLHAWDNYRLPPFNQPMYVFLDVTYHNDKAVVGDLYVQDRDGKQYFRFTGLEGTISKHLKRFFVKTQASA